MNTYIEQGRFGEFVSEIIEMEYKRKHEKAEKDDEERLWTMYVHSYSDKSFIEWKNDLTQEQKKGPVNYSMTNEQVDDVKKQAKGILSRISPV